eukprot:1760466-Rhodomonas_salina.11
MRSCHKGGKAAPTARAGQLRDPSMRCLVMTSCPKLPSTSGAHTACRTSTSSKLSRVCAVRGADTACRKFYVDHNSKKTHWSIPPYLLSSGKPPPMLTLPPYSALRAVLAVRCAGPR